MFLACDSPSGFFTPSFGQKEPAAALTDEIARKNDRNDHNDRNHARPLDDPTTYSRTIDLLDEDRYDGEDKSNAPDNPTTDLNDHNPPGAQARGDYRNAPDDHRRTAQRNSASPVTDRHL